MKVKAFAKINICLDVTGKRNDGYHTIKSVMQTVSLCDDITVEKLDNGIEVDCSDKTLLGQDNLVYKAAQLFFERLGKKGGAKIFVNKQIPICGGLGGGSADAAAVLKALNTLYNAELSEQQLCEMGVLLGADVPFCIVGGTCLAEGIGEQLTILKPMPDCHVLIVKKGVKSSTADMYKRLDAEPFLVKSNYDNILINLENGNLSGICQNLSNSFESVCEQENLKIAKSKMYECNALYSGLSGAGPTVFGIFTTEQDCKTAENLILNQGFDAYICKVSKK